MHLLRIHFGGRWHLHSLNDLFTIIEELYTIAFYIDNPSEVGNENILRILLGTFKENSYRINEPRETEYYIYPYRTNPKSYLEVIRIEYGSPGITDLTGIGKIIEQIKDLIIEFFKMREGRRMRHLQEREKEIQIAEDEYKLVRMFLKDIHRLRLNDTEIELLERRIINSLQRLEWYKDKMLLEKITSTRDKGY